jgi:hypothetical protein
MDEKDKQILELKNQGKSQREIAQILRISQPAVNKRLLKLHLPDNPNDNQTDNQKPDHLYSFSKNSLEEVIARLVEFRGKQYADIRVYYGPNQIPIKKGLTLSLDLIPELKKAIKAIEDATNGQGL